MGDEDEVPTTIDGVLDALDAIVASALESGNRVGYFAALYRRVTAKVKEGIASGFFDDGPRMERLDVVFANRYLRALRQFERGEKPTLSWKRAFEGTRSWRPILLQHLLVGINAHINLDLGVAAAEVAPRDALPGLRRDFDRINEILASLIREVQRQIGDASPWIALLDWVGGRSDDHVIRFSIEVARIQAWRFAAELAPLPPGHWGGPIGVRDARVAVLAGVVLHPGLLSAGLLLIRARESNNVRHNIEVLSQLEPPSLEVIEERVRQARAPTE